MRTTVTLEAEVTRLIEAAMHRERKSFKRVINEAIRRGLEPGRVRKARPPFRVAAHRARLLPGIDRMAFNRMADDLEDQAILSGAGQRRS